jgi:hypothetical protein
MTLVSCVNGAQFTPAGVLRLPLDGAASPAAVLGRMKDWLIQLQN